MTQEDKDLLLKELCTRLPYGVKMEITHWRNRDKGMIDSKIYRVPLNINKASVLIKQTSDVRPYLFPLSSMTEEQILAFWKIEFKDNGGYENDWDFPLYPPKVGNHFIIEALDWLNRNHFDYRGLIEKGLAIDATGLNVY